MLEALLGAIVGLQEDRKALLSLVQFAKVLVDELGESLVDAMMQGNEE